MNTAKLIELRVEFVEQPHYVHRNDSFISAHGSEADDVRDEHRHETELLGFHRLVQP